MSQKSIVLNFTLKAYCDYAKLSRNLRKSMLTYLTTNTSM